jgi:hypothetical protein
MTVLRLDLPPTLQSMIPVCRDHASKVKQWLVGAENLVISCDLQVLVDETVEPVSP